jgi:hypothetical protein
VYGSVKRQVQCAQVVNVDEKRHGKTSQAIPSVPYPSERAKIDLTTSAALLATRNKFSVRKSAIDADSDAHNCLQAIANAGCKLNQPRFDLGGIRYEYAK